MRKIITADVFKMARIIKAAGVKGAIATVFDSTKREKVVIYEDDSDEIKEQKRAEISNKQKAAGVDAIMTIFEACSTETLEKMLYDFLGGITEKKPEEVANQTLEMTIEDIKTIVSENNILNFFEQAGQLTE